MLSRRTLVALASLQILLACLVSGCYLRKEIDPARLIHDPSRRVVTASPGPGRVEIQRATEILGARARLGAAKVSDREVVESLGVLAQWKREGEGQGHPDCPPFMEAVATLFRDPSEEVRYYAVEAAGKIGCREIESDLLRVRDTDRSSLVREVAAEALISLGLSDEAWEE